MAALARVIEAQDQALHDRADLDLNHKHLLAANPRDLDTPNIDLQIHEAFEELRRLKAEHIELRTKELFMQTILDAKSLDDLPTSQETGRAEVSLQVAKRDLRKVKASRGQAEKDLAATVSDLGQAARGQKEARDEALRRLRQARAAAKASDVRGLLGRRDIAEIEALVEDVDQLDASCCRDIVSLLREERRLLERDANQRSLHVESLRKEVDELESDVSEMQSASDKLKREIAENDKENPEVAKLRHECMLQEQLETMLAALTGVRVAEIRENGISLELNAYLFVPHVDGHDRTSATHLLDIGFAGEDSESSTIADMAIRPADVEVNDLCRDSSSSLAMTVQAVCSRLATFITENGTATM